ncbi:hypothetical protein ACE0DR_02750 [Azotobacter sp. CWF10]
MDRSDMSGGRPQCDRRNALEPAFELIVGYAVALRDFPEQLAEQPDVELHRLFHDPVGIDLPGDGLQHAIVVLLLQIDGQAIHDRIFLLSCIQPVPRHLHGQPLLGPVAGKPGDEIRIGAPVDEAHPFQHDVACVIRGLPCRLLRGGDDVAIDLAPGTFRNHDRRRLPGGMLPRSAPCQHRHQQDEAQGAPAQHRKRLKRQR